MEFSLCLKNTCTASLKIQYRGLAGFVRMGIAFFNEA
jgi:hypothetical protein